MTDAQPLAMPPALAATPAKAPRGRLLGTLLYGRNVDRTAKARARVGLAILAFATTIAYDCPIKSFNSIQGSTSRRWNDTHL